jgi:tRNA G18 (ribose-2'-O)-methylase SpoU
LNNIGSVFRTSDAFLVEKIFLCGITATPPNKEIHKTALGATETVAWEHSENVLEVIEKLKSEGVKVFAIEPFQYCHEILNKNIKINKFKNIKIIKNILSNKIAKYWLRSGSNYGDSCNY